MILFFLGNRLVSARPKVWIDPVRSPSTKLYRVQATNISPVEAPYLSSHAS